MIASASEYPSFLEHLGSSGPIFQVARVLLLVTFIYGFIRIRRESTFTVGTLALAWAPAFIGCVLGALQTVTAVAVVHMNEGGMVTYFRPDRYVGHIRIYLGIGVAHSLILLGVAWYSQRRPGAPKVE